MAMLTRNVKRIFPDIDWNVFIKYEWEVMSGRLGYE